MDGSAARAAIASQRGWVRWVLDAVAGISDALIVVDAEARIVYRNPAADRLVGPFDLTPDPTTWSTTHGLHLADETTPFPPRDLPLARALRGEAAHDVSMFVRNDRLPCGVHLIVNASALRDDAGTIRGAVCIFRDATQRMRIAEDMRLAKDALEQRVLERTEELAQAQENLVRQERLAVLGQLAGGVAHQIRNPLAAILNASYVLNRHLAPEQHPDVADALLIIRDEVRHANIIITSLLDYARVRTPDRHPASLVELVERVVASEWIPSNVAVLRALPATDPVMRNVDADQLQGAISNLVRNAVDAMPDGGELRVALTMQGDEIVISVADTGMGISEQLRPHLFEALHSTKPLGIGLGLVTARRFVEAHGGRIASIDVERGARFEIRLP